MKLEWEWLAEKDHWKSQYDTKTFQVGALAYCRVTDSITLRAVMDATDGTWWVFINSSGRGYSIPGAEPGTAREDVLAAVEAWVYWELMEAAGVLRKRIDGRQAGGWQDV